MKAPILILGMGYLGSPLASLLVKRGYEVIGTYARTIPSVASGIQAEQCDIADVDRWTEKSHWRRAKTWICLLPPSCSSEYVSSLKKWILLAETYQIEHIIYTSSISVFSDKSGEIDEHSPTSAATESAEKIVAVEQAILQSHVPHKTVLRLAGLFDSERHPIYRLAQRQVIENAQQVVNMVHRVDVLKALLHAIDTPMGTRIRHIVHPAHPTREQFYQQQAHRLGIPLPPFQFGIGTGKIIQTVHNDFPIPHLGIDVQ